MSEELLPLLGITVGDLNGIGIEVILKTLEDKRIRNSCVPVIYGSSNALNYYRKMLNLSEISFRKINAAEEARPNTINLINCWNDEVHVTPGEYSEAMGKYALMALNQASDDLREGKIEGLVTGPVNKQTIQAHAPDFRGQTEYLEKKVNSGKSLMVLASEQMVVALVTTHLPLKEVCPAITEEAVAMAIAGLHQSLRSDFLIHKPRIGVLGLNPHAGDGGLLGSEDRDIVAPAIQRCKEKNILAFGPYGADGWFGSGGYREVDGTLAMYHDQGLVAFKALNFGKGVNFTAGLPVVRTSPDHGTAYGIAGKNQADEDSFRAALFMALDIAANRKDHKAMHRNPLRPRETIKERR